MLQVLTNRDTNLRSDGAFVLRGGGLETLAKLAIEDDADG
jgi:hypothetical protein